MNEEMQLLIRIRGARNPPRATPETRVALFVGERGPTEGHLAKFYLRRRKNCKPRFDYQRFAKDQSISMDWLFDRDLRAHPRGLRRQRPRRTNSEAMKQKREMRDAIRGRVRDFAAARDLSPDDSRPAMTTKHFELVQFAEKYSVSIEWLITGKGRIAKTQAEPA